MEIPTKALINSGSMSSCLNKKIIEKHQTKTEKVEHPIQVYNADGILNQEGAISKIALLRMKIGEHEEWIEMGISNSGKTNIFLGYDWLREHKPTVDYWKATIWFENCPRKYRSEFGKVREWLEAGSSGPDNEDYLRMFATHVKQVAMKEGVKKCTLTFEDVVPEKYWKYCKVFDTDEFNVLP